MSPTAAPHADHLHLVRERLHRDYDALVGAAAVDRAVELATHHFDDAAVDAFVPVLVERTARRDLRAAER